MDHRLHLIGNAHLDPAWLWLWQEGYGEVRSTFSAALDRLAEYPEFTFTCSAAAYYKWLEEDYPEIFERIRGYVREGRWEIAGGWWVQSDCNMPCGETFARNALYAQNYFRTRFGKICTTGYSVDSFGQNASLPMLLRQSGMTRYVYQRPGQHEKEMDSSVFLWRSDDGSQVTAARLTFGYGAGDGKYLREKTKSTEDAAEKGNRDLLLFYGVGNHGGGPTIKTIEELRKSIASGNPHHLTFSTLERYFSELGEAGLKPYAGDLEHHASGCYAAHSELKKKYRHAENALLSAEKFGVMAQKLTGKPCAGEKIDSLWEILLFNTFHDILCGCSIRPVCDEAMNQLGEVASESARLCNISVQQISSRLDTLRGAEKTEALHRSGYPVAVFNPLPWEVTVPVRVRGAVRGADGKKCSFAVFGPEGNAHCGQSIQSEHLLWNDTDSLFLADLPAFGYRMYFLRGSEPPEEPSPLTARIVEDAEIQESCRPVYGGPELENEFLRVRFSRVTGGISSIFDKTCGKEILSGPAAVGSVVNDWECDTWAHGETTFRDEIGRLRCEKLEIAETGSVRCSVKSVCRFGTSAVTQIFRLYRGERLLRAEVRINWNEEHCRLRLLFPVNVKKPVNTYQIPFGRIEKECTGEEEVSVGWFDVSGETESGEQAGLTLASDSKYSFSAEGSVLGMTALRSAVFADHGGIRRQELDYDSFDLGRHDFTYAVIPHGGKTEASQADRAAAELCTTFETVLESGHAGSLPDSGSFCSADRKNIVISTVKKSLAGDADILRARESDGAETDAVISFFGRSYPVHFRPFEVKTLKIEKNGTAAETNFLEEQPAPAGSVPG